MIKTKKKIDKVSIALASSKAAFRIKSAKRLVEDEEKEQRLKRQICTSCYYSGRIGGASMTETQCAICSKEMSFTSTATDILCKDCAAENQLCKSCGADIELKDRRKPRPYEAKK